MGWEALPFRAFREKHRGKLGSSFCQAYLLAGAQCRGRSGGLARCSSSVSFRSGSTLKKVDPTGTAAIGACWFSEAIRQAKFTARFNGTPALVRPHRLLLTRRMVRAFLPLHTIFRRSRGDIPYWELLGVGCLHRVPTDLPHCSFSVL